MKFTTNLIDYEADLLDLVKVFPTENDNITLKGEVLEDTYLCTVTINDDSPYTLSKPRTDTSDKLVIKKEYKHCAKIALYEALNNKYKQDLPWGALTGVRPTKIGYDYITNGTSYMNTEFYLNRDYHVSKQKAKLVVETIKNQKGIIVNDKLVNFYVNIPFCPTRCAYCNFVSTEVTCMQNLIPVYLETLIKEIRAIRDFMMDKCYMVKNIYIGGGTPSTLSADDLDRLLSELHFMDAEFTVECGRPDTITKEKLDVLKKHHVDRISINPQTFSDRTLKLIGRRTTTKQILEAYALALDYDFKINMDLIAGLPNESFRTFKKSLDIAVELQPANITVHTLAIKNNSYLQNANFEYSPDIEKMITYSYTKLKESGYAPYYMYRQKNMMGNFENVGYCKPNTACRFNIESMEELNSVIAVGAGGISKRVNRLEKRIERSPNVKDIHQYIDRVDEMVARKIKLFS